MKASEIRKDARASLKGKWGTGVLMFLLSIIVELVLLWIPKLAGGPETTIGYILNIAMFVLLVPLSLGLIFAFMKLKRNEDVKSYDFITLGFSNFGKAWSIWFSKFVALLVPALISFVGMILTIVGTARFFNMSFKEFVDAMSSTTTPVIESAGSPDLLFVGMLLILAGWIYSIIKSFAIYLTDYIAYDEPELSSFKTVKKSKELMKGNKAKLFFLGLSFIGWAILGAITFGIGLLWVMPYMQVAFVCFYDAIIGKKESNPIETNKVENNPIEAKDEQ